jgi:hypothetical protein
MSPGEDEVAVTSLRWNHIVVGVATGLIALVTGFGLIQVPSQTHGTKLFVVLAPVFALMLYTAVSSFSKALYPAEISLQPGGILLTLPRKTRFVPWHDYNGMLGGPNLLMSVRDTAGKATSTPLGIGPVNLEVLIFEYAQGHSVVVPIRATARDQVSVAPLLWVAGGLVAFALALVAYSFAV